MQKFSFESMGTHWEITVWDKLSEARLSEFSGKIKKDADRFDSTYSRFKLGSLVSKISQKKGIFKVPRDFSKMLSMYFDLYKLSGKTVTPLVGVALSEMGYDPAYSLIESGKISKVPDLLRNVKIIDNTHVRTMMPLLFDFGALGKGYFVDKIAAFLKKEKIGRFLVNGSGDVYYQGKETIKVGLEHPLDSRKVIGTISMVSGAMCASASNRRAWGRNHHIINPLTLKPTSQIIATWVMAERCAVSDAIATCLFFQDPSNFTKKYKFEYLILNKQMRVKKSEGFSAELF